MRVRQVNERLRLVDDLPFASLGRLATALNDDLFDGVEEVVGSRSTLGVYGTPGHGWEDWILNQTPSDGIARIVSLPVCYERGEDLQNVAEQLGLTAERVIEIHTSQAIECFAVGFQPGFVYLGPIPNGLCGLPRRATPRVRVPIGSVGMCLDQTGVYPAVSPGGWHLIGQCPLCLVDIADNYFPLRAGDHVHFFRIDETEYTRREGERL